MPDKISRSGLAAVGATLLTAAFAYVVYFDYKRRNDAQFRRKLRKEKKRVDETVAQEANESPVSVPNAIPPGGTTPQLLQAAYEQAVREDPPTSPEEREAYFMTRVGMGEQFVARGSSFYFTAAISFYMALRVYPSDVELLAIYQKTIPPAVYDVVTDLHNLDVSLSSSARPLGEENEVEGEDREISPTRTGPPSETSSQDWDKLSSPDPTPS